MKHTLKYNFFFYKTYFTTLYNDKQTLLLQEVYNQPAIYKTFILLLDLQEHTQKLHK